MAQIFLIARTNDDVLNSFQTSLMSDQQSVHTFLTGANNFQAYFHIFTSYLRLQPDLLYFLLPNEKINLTERLLFKTLANLPNIKVAVSMTDKVQIHKSRGLSQLMKRADFLTLASRDCLSSMRGFSSSSKRQFRALLTPQVLIQETPSDKKSEVFDFIKYLSKEKLWVTPWDLKYFIQHLSFFEGMAKQKTWVFTGDRSHWSFHDHQWFQECTKSWNFKPIWFHFNHDADVAELLKQSEVFLMAGLEFSPLKLGRFSQLAAMTGVFTILDTHQIEAFSGLWTVNENCELIEKDQVQSTLVNSWPTRFSNEKVYRKKPRSAGRAIDESMNQLNRWISQTLLA